MHDTNFRHELHELSIGFNQVREYNPVIREFV